MPVYVGLDCGGSSSRVLATDSVGTVLFRGQAGAANLLSTPRDALVISLQAAAMGCPDATHVCGCFAGLVGPNQKREAENLLRETFPSSVAVRAEPDYAAAMVACGPDTGACVIAGTGSIVCSRTPSGWTKTGGRGPLIGDPGSASRIGRETLGLFLDDPENAPSSLTKAVLSVFGSVEPLKVVQMVYMGQSPAAVLAKLARPIGLSAGDGEAYAIKIIQSEMKALAKLLKTHLSKNQRSERRVGLAGGLWKSGAVYRETFMKAIEEMGLSDHVEVFVLKKPPVEGAVELAMEMALGH